MKKNNKMPIILFEGEHGISDLAVLKKHNRIWEIRDIYDLQLEELFKIKNPILINSENYISQRDVFVENQKKCPKGKFRGNWIYLPWNGLLLHMLKEEDYFILRTNRNRNIITQNEQKKLRNFSVGIVGLSVGSGIATVLSYGGISNRMKLAEFDTLDTSNLNRMRVPVYKVGQKKVGIINEQIFEVNPYAELINFPDGLTDANIDKFISGQQKVNLIFEIIDNFEMKIKLRLAARKARVPVISFANLGDGILIDIERFDQNYKLPLFNGLSNAVIDEIMARPDKSDKIKNEYAIKLVGIENIPKRTFESVKDIGKTLVGRPQLISTVNISASLGAFFARRIALGQTLPSGRKFIDFKCFY